MKNGNDVKDGNVNEQVKIICSVFFYMPCGPIGGQNRNTKCDHVCI